MCFCLLKLRIRPSVLTEFKLNQVSLPLVYIQFLVFSRLLKIFVCRNLHNIVNVHQYSLSLGTVFRPSLCRPPDTHWFFSLFFGKGFLWYPVPK